MYNDVYSGEAPPGILEVATYAMRLLEEGIIVAPGSSFGQAARDTSASPSCRRSPSAKRP